jgi:hypothetical protein
MGEPKPIEFSAFINRDNTPVELWELLSTVYEGRYKRTAIVTATFLTRG